MLVTIDTLRADHVGCYGDARATTPTLDALARRGTRFETAISPAPLTLPSHTTLLTGLDPPRHGVRGNGAYRLGAGTPTLAVELDQAGFRSAAFVSAFVLERRFGLARGFEPYDDGLATEADEIDVASRPAGDTVDAALAWLARAPERFFLWVHLYDPHAPYEPPEPYRSRQLGRPYDGEIAYADAELGRLLAAVEARFPGGGTLVVVTADHGESLGEHGEPSHAYGVYDATQRVPLIFAGPGVPEGLVVRPQVRLADVEPTLLALVGLPVPEGRSGRSLVPLLRGEVEAEPRIAWVETLATQLEMGWSPLLGVRTASHKYVRAPRPELYDLVQDPGETRNLAADEPALAAQLDGLVAEGAADQRTAPNLGVDPETTERLLALGYLADARVPDAARLGEVGGVDPKDAMGELETLREALTLMKQRRGAEALARFRTLRASGYEIEVLRGQAALLAGALSEARAAGERARHLEPEHATALVLLGRVEETAGRPDLAKRRFREALALDEESGAALVGLGRLAEGRGDRDGARDLYEQARHRRPLEAEALWRLAALAIERDDGGAAHALLAELPQRMVRSPEAAARLARAERRAGRLDLARLRVEGALRDHPEARELRELAGELTPGDAAGGAP